MDSTGRENEIIKGMTDVEYYPVLVEEEADITKYTKIPFSRVAALGTGLEPLTAVFQNVIKGGKATSGLYRVTVPVGGRLAEFRNGSGFLGSVLTPNGAVGGGQAVLNPISFNPTTLFMAVTLASVDKKLDDIQETQREILDFLVQKEKSESKGDLYFLADVLNNFKFNWDNDKYKNSNHIKVLDIKQSAERKIYFYREQIKSNLNKKSPVSMDKTIKKQRDKIKSEFGNYQLALYLYSFSSFLEILLLKNFDSTYLAAIANKIEEYSFKYRELYTICYEHIKNSSRSSMEFHAFKVLASGSMAAKKIVAKVPVINKSQLNDNLTETRNKLEKNNLRRIDQTMEPFVDRQISIVCPFIDNINTINKLYNQPVGLLFDKENIYVEIAGE